MATQILVAEDDPKQAELIRLYLERDGFDVSVVHDGRAALDRIRANPPGLVVLDVMMPGIDGERCAAGALPGRRRLRHQAVQPP
jgi:DNA-binding response OmpR family regulator